MTVTVYYTWVPDNLARALEDRWLKALPPKKRDAIRRMRFDKGRAASLLGLQLLKRAVKSLGVGDLELASLNFPRGSKPYCDLPVDFNISHSKDMVVCALATGAAVGVDTERLREIRIKSFQRFLNPRERAWIGGDSRRFFELWTQKEAVVKGHGDGGIANLRKVNIKQGKATIRSQIWTLHELKIHTDYVTHVAIDRDEAATPLEVSYLAITG
jgi:4'-phosphopantetheinyl transferase